MKFTRDEELAINLLHLLKNSVEFQRAKDLAEKLDTTEIYLHSIILKLKKAKLVNTQAGSLGGVTRASASSDVTVLKVIKALKREPRKMSGKSSEILTNVLDLLNKEKL